MPSTAMTMPERNTGLTPMEAQPSALTPIQLAAMAEKIDGEKLLKLMEAQERWEANFARKAFLKAFADFKTEAVKIAKGASVNDGPLKGRKYADLRSIVDAVTPALSSRGLTLSWKLTKDEPQWMEVTCTLRHEQGHSESVSMGGAPDTGPGRNAIQARGSAKTYLERYTATAILGMAAADADDDAQKAGFTPAQAMQQQGEMAEGQFLDCKAAIEGAGDYDQLEKAYLDAREKATNANDLKAIETFANVKNKRWAQLRKQGVR